MRVLPLGVLLIWLLVEVGWGLGFGLEVRAWPAADLAELAPFSEEQGEVLRTHLNPDHLRLVEAGGPTDVAGDADLQERLARGELEEIATPLIGLRQVSFPYLRPVALREAERIAGIFRERLRECGVEDGMLLVSSALRTLDYQRRLRDRNPNATSRSTHTSGLTFDLHYERFGPASRPGEPLLPWRRWWWDQWERRCAPAKAHRLKGLLAGILIEEQAAGRILVIYEREQPVFHVTVAPAAP